MPCCGQGRIVRPTKRQTSRSASGSASTPHYGQSQHGKLNVEPVYMQYTGRSGMTVFGPITGLRYRFTAPGAMLAIDPRDAPSMANVPRLQRVTRQLDAG